MNRQFLRNPRVGRLRNWPTVLIICISLFACTGYHWNYNFSLSESYRQSDLKGWVFEPKFWMHSWKPRGADSLVANEQYFSLELEFEIPNMEDIDSFYNISLEDVSVMRFETNTEETLVVKKNGYWRQSHSLYKYFKLAPLNPTATTTPKRFQLFIPLEVDSVRLEFDVILQAGKRVTFFETETTKYPKDSVAVFEGSETLRIPVSTTLYRRLDKLGTTIGLLNRNLKRDKLD